MWLVVVILDIAALKSSIFFSLAPHFTLSKFWCGLEQISRRRQWHPTPALLPGKSHGWRSLVGCSPWGRTESDTTEVT